MGNITEMLQQMDYKNVLKYFVEISNVPRGSGFNEKISSYLVDFAKKQGFKYIQDDSLNVIIYKPATSGYEGHTPVIIQGHMDMVCVGEGGVVHDFKEDGLELLRDGDWLHADRTTLGADDGIALAYGLALLADDTIAHPALEILFTTDEETGMYGAKALDPALLSGRYLINLDSENEGIVLAGCAGGIRVTGTLPLKKTSAKGCLFLIRLEGLMGGHSGAEIDKYRVNAVYQLARLLFDLKKDLDYLLIDFEGGEKDNAIPALAEAKILVEESGQDTAAAAIRQWVDVYKKELGARESGMKFGLFNEMVREEIDAIHPMSTEKLLFLLMQAPNGVQMMSSEIEGLVESSLNLGIFHAAGDVAEFHFSVRSSISSYKYFVRDKLVYLFEFLGGECECDSEYPAWEYRKDSVLRKKFVELFEECYGRKPEVQAIHAGLECGLICEKIPEMDIISVGPEMKDIHTPKERLSISSAIRLYQFLEKLLALL